MGICFCLLDDNLNFDIGKDHYALFYDMNLSFQNMYYSHRYDMKPLLSIKQFKSAGRLCKPLQQIRRISCGRRTFGIPIELKPPPSVAT